MPALTTLTTIINLGALAASLWLGFYLITRSPRGALSRLAALMLWASDTYFLSNALWNNLKSNVLVAWMLQATLLTLPLMLHLTVRLSAMQIRKQTHLTAINSVAVPLAYVIASILMVCGVLPSSPPVGIFNPGTQLAPEPVSLGFASRTASPLYPLFLVFLILVSALALVNLWRARAQTRGTTPAQTFTAFFVAVALVGIGAAYSGFSTWFRLNAPTFPADILFGVSILLVGFAVARYAALLEGRLIERDFLHAILVVGSFTVIYVLIGLALYLIGQVTFVALVLILIGTIVANSLLDGVRLALDRVFYQSQFQKLRGNLRSLAREAGTSGTLAERLQAILTSLCHVFRIQRGFIALRQGDRWIVQATYDTNPIGQTFELAILSATETIELHSDKMAWLIPLFAGGNQIGAIALGGKESARGYDEADLELLEDLADQIAGVIHAVQLQEENARAIDRMVQDFREKERTLQLQMQEIIATSQGEKTPIAQDADADILLPQVEDALRQFHDLAYLGEHPLAKLHVVERCLQERHQPSSGFIERGKALGEILVHALDQLRPSGAPPNKNQMPPREWHPFIILHDSYVLDKPNRDIMSDLFISEGTFNRTRRRALRSLAKSLAELEQATSPIPYTQPKP